MGGNERIMYAKIIFYDDFTRKEIPNTSIYGRVYGKVITEDYDYGEDETENETRTGVVEITVGDER